MLKQDAEITAGNVSFSGEPDLQFARPRGDDARRGDVVARRGNDARRREAVWELLAATHSSGAPASLPFAALLPTPQLLSAVASPAGADCWRPAAASDLGLGAVADAVTEGVPLGAPARPHSSLALIDPPHADPHDDAPVPVSI